MNVVYASYNPAVRKQGVCQGTLWRQLEQLGQHHRHSHHPQPSSTSSSSSSSSSTCEYCVLTGVRLRCYESLAAFQRGDVCQHAICIVGASAFQPVTAVSASLSSSTTTTGSTATAQSAVSSNPSDASFRLVSSQGTHYYCQAPSAKCRDLWLSTLYSSLEQALLESDDDNSDDNNKECDVGHVGDSTTRQPSSSSAAAEAKPKAPTFEVGLFSPPEAQVSGRPRNPLAAVRRFCRSCGSLDSTTKPLVNLSTAGTSGIPLWQYGREARCDVCHDCLNAQGLLDHLEFVRDLLASSSRERRAVHQALDLLRAALAEAEALAPAPAPSTNAGDAPVDGSADNDSSSTGGGSWTHVGSDRSSTPSPPDLAAPDQRLSRSWHSLEDEADSHHPPNHHPSAAAAIISASSWVQVPPTQASASAVLAALQTPTFAALARTSPLLDRASREVLGGLIDAPDFVEQLELASGQRSSRQSRLKQQAFRVAGDMGSAMKLLAEHALRDSGDPDMLRCILDFFLDLCEARRPANDAVEGERSPEASVTARHHGLSSIAFFWPQLCHIHLRMLPPKNYDDLARIDLVEDFLLTIAARHSIHLALELVWSHTADLEDSILSGMTGAAHGTTPSLAPAACRRRRFAVLRFVCELESVLFDFEGGWGGGSVSLGKMVQPTGHQVELLKATMRQIQQLRRKNPHRLTRSFLLESLSVSKFDQPPDQAVHEKLRIARNADYFSSHLNFTRRVCDTAEKLRFMEVETRARALEQELGLLNASGAMGGDPLNRLRDDDLVRVVRVPTTEGHVFRSKERTPVLLLVEVVNEGAQVDLERDLTTPSTSADEMAAPDNSADLELVASEQREQPGETSFGAESADTWQTAVTGATAQPPGPDIEQCDLSRESSGGTVELEGSLHDKPSPRPATGLKRFDVSQESPQELPGTPKRTVELLVSSAMEHQLHGINIPDLNPPFTDPERLPDTAGEDDTEPLEIYQDAESDPPPLDEKIVPPQSPLPEIEPEPPKSPADQDLSPRERDASKTSHVEGKGVDTSRGSKKKSTLGSLACVQGDRADSNVLAPTGDVRREVLTAIMMRGMQGKDSIAAGAADSAQRSLKELERQRATELLLTGSLTSAHADGVDDGTSRRTAYSELESTRERLVSLGIGSISPSNSTDDRTTTSEEDEVLEAIRLLLIQNRVAQGQLSESDAARVLQHTSLSPSNSESGQSSGRRARSLDPSEMPTIDAGDVDPRLVGCGALPPAILQALTLWKAEMVTGAELLELVKKDLEFLRHSVLLEAENVEKLNEDSAFWGRFSFGERWAEKKSRIAATSPEGSAPGWDLVGVIVKSNDDLRQESFVMQLIELCQEAFELSGLELWVNPYRILATGRTTGVIEMVRNAMSFDALKKRPGYGKGGLREHLQRMTEFTADPGGAFKSAQQNFVRSLASYSLLSYLFQFKDRHNGNLLLDTAGHVIHIDFGFVFGVAPGGSFSLEMSTPFKLTEEMLDVMGGLKSPLFSEFVTLFCCGFLALQPYAGTFLTIVEIMCKDSTFKCFEGRDTDDLVSRLRERFAPDLSKEETVSFALDLIRQAVTSYGTRQYDMFQYLSQGIAT